MVFEVGHRLVLPFEQLGAVVHDLEADLDVHGLLGHARLGGAVVVVVHVFSSLLEGDPHGLHLLDEEPLPLHYDK